jgi:two-component system, sensor histidine kinase YesM
MRKAKIRNKLILNYLILILLPIIVVSFFVIRIYSQSMLELAQESANKSLTQIDSYLNGRIEDFSYHLEFANKDKQVQSFFKRNGNISDIQKSNIQNLLDGYSNYIDDVSFIGLVDIHGKVISSEMRYKQSENLHQQDWFTETINSPDDVHIETFAVGENPFVDVKTKYTDVVLISKAIKNQSTGDVEGTISYIITMSLFENALNNLTPVTGGYFYITGENDKIVYSPLFQKIIEPKQQEKYDLVEMESTVSGWKIWGVIPLESVQLRLKQLQLLLMAIFASMFVILIFIAVWTSNSIVKPIKELKALMKKAEKGEFHQYFDYSSEDEIGELCAGFNTMIDKIDQLLNQVYNEQRDKRKAEIEALQSNIKPHFLYNTLDTIHWMSKKYQADDVIETVDALATLFRIGLSKGKNEIPIEHEIAHVKSYLLIQKVRYSEILDYDIEVEDEIKGYYIQKIILQPFVENALYHGIKEGDEKGHIEIKAFKQASNIVITIKDNGVGIEEKELLMLKATLKDGTKGKSYGILNVNQRLRLSYGEQYGIKIESTLGEGTTVTVVHPIIDHIS